MLRSMTGFGRCFLEEDDWTQIWEIRSVNGKHLDIRWKLPQQIRPLEPLLEKKVKQFAARGRVEITLYLQNHKKGLQTASFNEAQADALLETIAVFASSRGDNFTPDYNRFLSISSLWEDAPLETDDMMSQSLEKGLAIALEDWNESRTTEAAALAKDLQMRLLRMQEWTDCIANRAPGIKEERFLLVRDRLSEVLEKLGQELDENRFLQEVTILADKLDVSEELTRLNAHFERVKELLEVGSDAGRKLDFTLQECFREITTCGNKIQDIQVSRLVVDLKNELEKCREQVQNVE